MLREIILRLFTPLRIRGRSGLSFYIWKKTSQKNSRKSSQNSIYQKIFVHHCIQHFYEGIRGQFSLENIVSCLASISLWKTCILNFLAVCDRQLEKNSGRQEVCTAFVWKWRQKFSVVMRRGLRLRLWRQFLILGLRRPSWSSKAIRLFSEVFEC